MKTMMSLAGVVLCASVAACSSTGDTAALMAEAGQACSTICADHPGMESFSYEAGGGSPLLFSGRIATSCGCADAAR